MEKIKIIVVFILSVLFMGTLSFVCPKSGFWYPGVNQFQGQAPKFVTIVVPHHLLMEKKIDNVYQEIAARYAVQQVIVISPNHFSTGFYPIQQSNIGYDGMKIDNKLYEELRKNNVAGNASNNFYRDHGVTAELGFVKKYWPNATYLAFELKEGIDESRLNQFCDEISQVLMRERFKLSGQSPQTVLIIGSIDFTHYASEETAKKNDQRTAEFLKNNITNNFSLKDIIQLAKSLPDISKSAIAMDSPETFYTTMRLSRILGIGEVNFLNRSSSASLTGIIDPMQNTSHIYAIIR